MFIKTERGSRMLNHSLPLLLYCSKSIDYFLSQHSFFSAPHPRFAGKSGLGTRGDVILQLDWTIGEIMHTLDSLHIADNTILIFTSDNGPVIDDGYQDQASLFNGFTYQKRVKFFFVGITFGSTFFSDVFILDFFK